MGRVKETISDRLLDDPEVIAAIAFGLKPGQEVIDLIKRIRDITIETKDEVID